MTNLQDLRETLRSHADLDDTAAPARVTAVHDRVRRVHRRRRAVVAGGAAALLVGALVAFNLPENQDPAPAGAGDLVAPKTITSTGYTYELESTSTDEYAVTLRIPKSDQPMLISWGTEGGAADPVRVRPVDGEPFTSAGDAFDDYYLVSPGDSGTMRISEAEGDVAVSTYTLSDVAPEGVTRDGSTFRETIGIWKLAGAELGGVGAPEVSFDVTLPSGPVSLREFCAGVPRGYWVNVSVAGKAPGYTEGCEAGGFDPGTGNSSTDFRGGFGTPGSMVRLRTWISKEGEVVIPAGARKVRVIADGGNATSQTELSLYERID